MGIKNPLSALTPILPANIVQFNPANPTGTASATKVMMGLGSTCTFTPKNTGKVKFMAQFFGQSDTQYSGLQALAKFGTGSPPVNGVAATGTNVGVGGSAYAANVGLGGEITLIGYVTGLTIGTTYWFDISLNALVSGTASLLTIVVIIEEVLS